MTPKEALWLILETDHSTSMAQLSVSTSILAGVGGHVENNHSGDLKKRLTTEEERGQQEHSQILTAKQIAFMIYSFKTSSVQGAVLDLADPLKVELRSDNPRAFDSCWEETSFSLAKGPRHSFWWKLVLPTVREVTSGQRVVTTGQARFMNERGEPNVFNIEEHGDTILGPANSRDAHCTTRAGTPAILVRGKGDTKQGDDMTSRTIRSTNAERTG